MKTFSILEQDSSEKSRRHPQEDYLLISGNRPIFSVADGVTLEPSDSPNYPDFSRAGEVARIFCEEIIRQGEILYPNFQEESLLHIFQEANSRVDKYNKEQGRTKENINFYDFDLFHATGAFVVIKGNTVYWASICDSFVMHFDGNGANQFKSPPCGKNYDNKLLEDLTQGKDGPERTRILRQNFRNKVNRHNQLIGYGAITGEDTAMRYLNHGSFPVLRNKLIAICTDGYEDYLDLPEFVSIFREWPRDLEDRVHKLSLEKSKEDYNTYGHERSLIIIKV